MSQSSQSVARLKELLFDDETQALADLARRLQTASDLDAQGRADLALRLDNVSNADAQGRAELRAALDNILSRAITSERLSDSVAAILSEALRKAEVAQHADLAGSIAPVVITTIKAELRNSQDEMVEALYPLTGRMVKAYLASAMKDLADQMNRSIEQTPVMLRLRSLTTGRSVAELAMADTQDFEIDDVLLIRRGSGELLARWPEASANGRDHAMSGVLAAINEFANEALSADQGQLRQIGLGGAEVYLRGSPSYLLAARCSGSAPPSIERLIDEAFLGAIQNQHAIDHEAPVDVDVEARKASSLAAIASDLKKHLADEKARLKTPAGGGALKVLAVLILGPLLGWLGYGWYDGYAASQVRTAAAQTVAALPAMQGYPVKFDVAPFGRRVTVSGLVPSEDARFETAHGLRMKLPGTAIIDQLTLVPGAGLTQAPDLTPDVATLREELTDVERRRARDAALTGADRANLRLAAASTDVSRAAAAARTPQRRAALTAVAKDIADVRKDLGRARTAFDGATTNDDFKSAKTVFAAVSTQLAPLAARIEAAALPAGAPVSTEPVTQSPTTLLEAINELMTRSERIAAFAAAAPFAIALEPTPAPPPQQLAGPTPREKLEAVARAKAVFFDNGIEYRNADAVSAALKALAPLIRDAKILLRVIGYTDEAGGATINSPLAQQRADRVRGDLIAAGAPADLVAAVGRADRFDISAGTGAGSPNRRVEFEVGFDGEARQ